MKETGDPLLEGVPRAPMHDDALRSLESGDVAWG